MLEARRLWARREITKTTLGDVIKAAGFAPTDEGLLADPDLLMDGALLRRWNYDWMHCAFQAGFMSEAMWLAFKNIAILKFGSIGAGGDSMIGICGSANSRSADALSGEACITCSGPRC